MSIECSKILALASFFSLIQVSSAVADDSKTPGGFASKFERSLTVSVFQEVPGFSENLSKLDAKNQFLAKTDNWRSFQSSDVWVFFLKNEEHIEVLPEVAKSVLSQGESSNDRTTFHAQVLVDQNRWIYFSFVFVDAFDTADLREVACKSAAGVYDGIAAWDQIETTRAYLACEAL